MSYRLAIYNRTQNIYVIVAKSTGGEYNLGNVNVLADFMECSIYGDEIVIGDVVTIPDTAKNWNKIGGWNYYEKV